ncbi:glycerophosphodiester phosphodiesterase family protein [Roseococcus pinisoli]|uniref:Glycerophosphodiester phosphodiesterase n=1 Tax=Roseococcus pinisoli TaxID=2835040 RepID=A0ABS5QCH9_9PROT|nr:glycerophosphodiester phosphodiesterase family protein [Roseococcus pinisoli]MBS7811375.1 glycerophosphodiester phosphodiesterase [Roseococcus pinisoli]
MSRTEIASHRGGAFLWPENSLLAFRHALGLAAEQVEFDVHASRDGEPFVIHDATLDRTSDGAGPVAALEGAALRRHRLRGTGGEAVPSLEDVVALIGPSPQRLRMEIKAGADGRPYPGLVRRCAEVLGDRVARTVFMSFEAATVAEAAALGGFEQLVFLVETRPLRGMRPVDLVALSRSCGATEVGVHEGMADEALRDALRAAGLRLSVWGANHAPSIARALALGVDVLATDDPPLAIQMREGAISLR